MAVFILMIILISVLKISNKSTLVTATVTHKVDDSVPCALTPVSPLENRTAFWSFNSNTADSSSNYSAYTINNPLYFPEYTGPGKCILFNGIDQYMIAPFIPLYNRSFTIEMFVYINLLPRTSSMMTILNQCETIERPNRCLHIGIVDDKLFFSFNDDAQIGVTDVIVNRWNHLAFVFDTDTNQMKMYLNGTLAGSGTTSSAYLGTFGDTIVAGNGGSILSVPFHGYMDSLAIYTYRKKSACEIWNDASLISYFSWDGTLTTDQGPNRMQSSVVGSISSVQGRYDNGIRFSVSNSYVTIPSYQIFTLPLRSFSISIWVKPTAFGGTIIHVADAPGGDYTCFALLSLSRTGTLSSTFNPGLGLEISVAADLATMTLNQWTHVVLSYSVENGMRIYMDGILRGTSSTGTIYGLTFKQYLFVGSYGAVGYVCAAYRNSSGQFYGILDEFRLYNHEITEDFIRALASL